MLCKINAVFCNLHFLFPCVFQAVLFPLLHTSEIFLKQFLVGGMTVKIVVDSLAI